MLLQIPLMAWRGSPAAEPAIVLALLALLAVGAAASATGRDQSGLPGNKVVQPGVSYVFSRSRIQGGLPVEACSAICQVDVGCIAWTWRRLLRTCHFGYEFSPLSLVPIASLDAISGQPAQVFSPDQIDCTSQVNPGIDYTSWNVRSIPTQTAGECATVCAAFSASRCVAFTWRRILRSCELKFSLTGKFVRNENVISAVAGPCTGGAGLVGGGSGGGGVLVTPPGGAVAVPAVPLGGGSGLLGGGGGGGLLSGGGLLGNGGGLLGGGSGLLGGGGGSGGLLGGGGSGGLLDSGLIGGGDDDGDDDEDDDGDAGLGGLLGLGGQRAPVPVTLGVRQPAVPLQVLMPQATPGQPSVVVQQALAQPQQQQQQQQSGPGLSGPSLVVPGVPLGTTTDFVTNGGSGGGSGPAPGKPTGPKPTTAPAGVPAAGGSGGPAPGGNSGGGSGGVTTTKIPVPGELQAECRKLSLDEALDHAVRDVGAFARDMREPVVEKFADSLARRKESVRAALKERLRGVAPGDRRGLQRAVQEAVAATVPEAAGGAVQLDGRPVSFAGIVWESLSTEPYTENCF